MDEWLIGFDSPTRIVHQITKTNIQKYFKTISLFFRIAAQSIQSKISIYKKNKYKNKEKYCLKVKMNKKILRKTKIKSKN